MQSRADLFGLLCFFVIEFIYKKNEDVTMRDILLHYDEGYDY